MKKAACFMLIAVVIIAAVFTGCLRRPKATPSDGTNPLLMAEKLIAVPTLCQYPELPTGCESVAATMVLRYYGETLRAGEFVLSWLSRNGNFYTQNGRLYGPDPHQVFVGNPFTDNGYGCYAEPIVNAVNRHSKICQAQLIEHKTLKELCAAYIDEDKPLLIWATMGMKESGKGTRWYLEDGSAFTWIAGEHCLVLVGYSDRYYFFNDPMSGGTVAYQKDIAEKRFAELGRQAVLIIKRNARDPGRSA